jgi:hypothetical protein
VPEQRVRPDHPPRGERFDRAALTARRLPYERLDQLVVDLLLGV